MQTEKFYPSRVKRLGVHLLPTWNNVLNTKHFFGKNEDKDVINWQL